MHRPLLLVWFDSIGVRGLHDSRADLVNGQGGCPYETKLRALAHSRSAMEHGPEAHVVPDRIYRTWIELNELGSVVEGRVRLRHRPPHTALTDYVTSFTK
jgi:hypothetical protein